MTTNKDINGAGAVHRLARGILPVLLGMALGLSSARADDTEIFFNQVDNNVKPNVLFIIDTSGSMSANVLVSQIPYQSSVTYAGNCNSGNRVYWANVNVGDVPDCPNNEQFFALDKLRCSGALDALATGPATNAPGYFTGRMSRHVRNGPQFGWRALNTVDRDPRHVECRSDAGVHGPNDASPALWAREGVPTGYTTAEAFARPNLNWLRANTATGGTYFSENYMNWFNDPASVAGTMTRLEIVQQALRELVGSTASINAGLMRFNGGAIDGGRIVQGMEDLASPAVRTQTIAAINAMIADGFTPLAESLAEALRFFQGGRILWGDLDGPVAANARTGNNYLSPIVSECQRDILVMLSDGAPVNDNEGDAAVRNRINRFPGTTLGSCGSTDSGDGDGCLDELAETIYIEDHSRPGLPGSNNLPGQQRIEQYYISFLLADTTLLQSAARAGNGEGPGDPEAHFFDVSDPEGLRNAFQTITGNVLETESSFVAPSVSTSQFDRSTNDDDLYFSLFKPRSSVRWSGNIKKFRLDFVRDVNGDPVTSVDADGNTVTPPADILDINQMAAVDPNTGLFDVDTTSFWTPSADAPDGGDVSIGGFASAIFTDASVATRNIYTYTGASVALTDGTNALHEVNPEITAANLGVSDPAERDRLLRWARGLDVNDNDADSLIDDARHQVGAALHSGPVVVEYGDFDGDPSTTSTFLFAINNDGYLHMIDAEDGSERFAYMPPEVLANISVLEGNAAAQIPRHGLDGDITVWRNDADRDGIISSAASSQDHVYLYFGQRRGGRNYFALDVTNPDQPRYLWSINGGLGGTDFAELGQTWSALTLGRIRLLGIGSDGTQQLLPRDVLIFGGGYDVTQDSAVTPTNDGVGRVVYIIDAATGGLIWHAAHPTSRPTPSLRLPAMTNSIPADVNALDLSSDGLIDRLYVGDMRGQVWRFDIDNTTQASIANRITGGHIAEIQQTSDSAIPQAEDNRRLYNQLSVSLAEEDGVSFLALAVGSGYRAHPLNEVVEDRFYMIRDVNVFSPPVNALNVIDYSTGRVNESDLVDRTELNAAGTETGGWYIRLASRVGGNLVFEGEKSLTAATVFGGALFFTTFSPQAAPSCDPAPGTARAYVLNLLDAAPITDLDESGDTDADGEPVYTVDDRSVDLRRGGIPPNPIVFFGPKPPSGVFISDGQGRAIVDDGGNGADDGTATCGGAGSDLILVGPEKLPCVPRNAASRTFWSRE